MQIYQLLYASSAAKKFDDEELSALLAGARRRNTEAGLTGILLYNDGNFIQLLEGDEAEVTATWGRIFNDPRHKGQLILFKGFVEQRLCMDWEMGFRNGNDLGGFDLDWETLKPRLASENAMLIRVMIETFYASGPNHARTAMPSDRSQSA